MRSYAEVQIFKRNFDMVLLLQRKMSAPSHPKYCSDLSELILCPETNNNIHHTKAFQ